MKRGIDAPSPEFGSARLTFTQLGLLPQLVRQPLPQPNNQPLSNQPDAHPLTIPAEFSYQPTISPPVRAISLTTAPSTFTDGFKSWITLPPLPFPATFSPMLAFHQGMIPHPAALQLLWHWLISTLIRNSNSASCLSNANSLPNYY